MTDSEGQPEKSPPMSFGGKVVLAIVGLAVLGAVFGGGDDTSVPATQSLANTGDVEAGATEANMVEAEHAEPAEPDLTALMTGPQRNAVRSAEDYLSFKGFSRAGLIEQLSSEYGSGYSVEDATVAVDSLNVDWNEQAAKSARDYLDFSGFSCDGLTEQLSSEYGSQFTAEQARYGAQQAGAC